MSMDESLEAAIRNNDIETVNHIINSGADIAKIEYDREGHEDDLFNVGKSFLMIAVDNNNLEMIKLLVNNYDNYDDKEDFYTTPIKRNRFRLGYPTLKEYLDQLDYNSNFETALILAVKQEKINIIKYLLSVGADPNIQDFSQKSALNYAIEKENKTIIGILIDGGADINIGSPPPRDDPLVIHYLEITKPSRLMNAEKRLVTVKGINDKNSRLGDFPFDTDLPERFVSDEDATADVIKRWIKERSGQQSTRRLQFTKRKQSPKRSSPPKRPKHGGRKRTKKRSKKTKKRGGRKRTIKRNKKKK